jgi:hypothetical protein
LNGQKGLRTDDRGRQPSAEAVSKRKNTPKRFSKPHWCLIKATTIGRIEIFLDVNWNKYFEMLRLHYYLPHQSWGENLEKTVILSVKP